MPDSKVTDLTSAGTLDGTEVLYAVKDPSGTPLDRKTTAGAIKTLSIGAGSVSIASGKTFTASNTLTLAGTDSTTITFGSASSSFPIVTSPTAATLQLGAADTTGTTAPTAQFLRVQSWSSSTNNNQLGADFTIQGSRGTGTGAGGSIIFQVAPASGSSNGVQNAYSTALTIKGDKTVLLGTTGGIISSPSSSFAMVVNNNADTLNCLKVYNSSGVTVGNGTSDPGAGNFTALGWISAGNTNATLYGEAANTLALRNGTNAQKFRVYNTYTSSTNYENFEIDWQTTANIALVGPTKGSGGGTQRVQRLQYLEDGGTGSTTPSLGTTCPAASATIKSWIKVITSDGTTAYIPCWA